MVTVLCEHGGSIFSDAPQKNSKGELPLQGLEAEQPTADHAVTAFSSKSCQIEVHSVYAHGAQRVCSWCSACMLMVHSVCADDAQRVCS